MSYMMLYKFNSAQNAQLFYNNASQQGLNPSIVQVPEGWIGPSGPSTGIGQPSSQSSSTFSWVMFNNPTQYNPYAGEYKTELIFDNSTRLPLYVSPNIDPNTITIKDGEDTIFYKGLPTPDWTPSPPAPLDAPIEFQPIYYPGQDDYWKYLQPVTDQPLKPDVPFQPDQPFTPDAPVETYDLLPPPPQPPGQAEGETKGPLNVDPNIDPGIFITPPGPVDPIARPPDNFKRFNPEIVSPISSQGPSASGTGISTVMIFVAIEAAQLNGGVTLNPIFRWSVDGINWNVASVDALGSGLWFAPGVEYANGTFFGILRSYPNESNFVGIYSTDGKSWVTVYSGSSFTFSFDSGQSAWVINGTTVVQVVPRVLTSAVADEPSTSPIADISQTAVTNPLNIAKNRLLSVMTAINSNFSPAGGFQYTATTISASIVAGGTGLPQPWPGAAWVTTLTFANAGSVDVGNNDLFYAPVVKSLTV